MDASYDVDGFSGIGEICFDSSDKVLGFVCEEVPHEFLEIIKIGGKETAIMELEMVPISIAVHQWKQLLQSHSVVLFTDNESVRASILKGSSTNTVVDQLMKDLFRLEEEISCQIWLERVPSQSNPADEPSRKICLTLLGSTDRIKVDVIEVWIKSAHSTGGDSAA